MTNIFHICLFYFFFRNLCGLNSCEQKIIDICKKYIPKFDFYYTVKYLES